MMASEPVRVGGRNVGGGVVWGGEARGGEGVEQKEEGNGVRAMGGAE